MCSSGAFLNFGHSDPPIKMEHLWLNNVHAYHGNAAVDCYIGVTRMSDTAQFMYGGGHVLEDFVRGKEVELRANSYGTDCYPRTELLTYVTLNDINQAILCNPRNGYQRYNCAVNSTDKTLYTYMGKLLPHFGNGSYSGAGELAPLCNDPDYETIGLGTRIFLGGGIGYVIGEGTQHNPKKGFGTLFVKGDLKQMSPDYLAAAAFTKYGTSLYVGLGIPIPILNEGLARKTAVRDSEITTQVIDYGIPRRDRPALGTVTYEELKGGVIEIQGKEVHVSSLSSLYKARLVANQLKEWIEQGKFTLTAPVERLPLDTEVKPMKVTSEIKFVNGFMRDTLTCNASDAITEVAEKIVSNNQDHMPVVDEKGKLVGIVTTFDLTRALARGTENLSDIITKKVITTTPDEPLSVAARKMKENSISALPVIDNKRKVIGIITSGDVIQRGQ
jgi:uncharacterized protein (DUF39 family)/CBS domain-containing protein